MSLLLALDLLGLLGLVVVGGLVLHHHARQDSRRLAAAQTLIDRQIESADALRRDLSQELHDDLLQRLFGLALDLDAGQVPKSALTGRLRDITVDLRRLAHSLHPADLAALGLTESLGGLVAEWQARTTATLKLEIAVQRAVPDAWVLTVFRWFQEAIGNAVQHASAERIVVRLLEHSEHLCLEVEDDGIGFSFQLPSVGAGMGLSSLRNRLIALGGKTVVRTEIGGGTTIRGGVPWPG